MFSNSRQKSGSTLAFYAHSFGFIFFVSVGILLLPGCARYKAKAVRSLPAATPLEQQTLSFSYHVYNKQDCDTYLDRNVIKKGYQPISITIYNNSSQTVHFCPTNITLPCVPAEEVAHAVHTSSINRAVGYGIPGLFIWPLLVPAIVDTVKSEKANKKLDIDFARKSLRAQIIRPYDTINGLIFVDIEQFTENFSIMLENKKLNRVYTLSTIKQSIKI
jgi:hypothetical protein